MDWLTFSVEIAKALGWPAATLIALMLFRRPLLELLALIRKVKYKDIEVEIAKKEIVETHALSVASGNAESFSFGDLQHFKQLADVSPRAAITEAWSRIEGLIYQAAKLPGMDSRPAGTSFSKVLASLRESATVEPSTLRIIEKMREIRNKAVHFKSQDLSSEDAMDYVFSMKHVEASLKFFGVIEGEPNPGVNGTLRDKADPPPSP